VQKLLQTYSNKSQFLCGEFGRHEEVVRQLGEAQGGAGPRAG
jgi:hypothetical protein